MKANITTYNLSESDQAPSQDACEAFIWQNRIVATLADGVGSSAYGGEAAERVVSSISKNFKSRPISWSAARALSEFCRLINRTLHRESIAKYDRQELLTTAVSVVIEGEELHGINVGDSRAYLLHCGELKQLSEDHIGQEVNTSHMLTRAVGMSADVVVHVFSARVQPDDIILLCSDGVYNQFEDDDILSQLQARISARGVVKEARHRSTAESIDDMSAIVIELRELGGAEEAVRQLDVPENLHAGQVIDGFNLISALNQNERTWLANRDGERLVIKFAPLEVLHSELIRDQFLKEIWSLVRLNKDFFTRAYVPENVSTMCYCMEYVAALTLKDYLKKKGALSVEDAILLTRFLLDACQFLIGQDLVHGDLKPENILVLEIDGGLGFKLIDFGSISEIFSVTSRVGTPSYLAPERFQSAPLSERTEVFALGTTVYEALTDHFPYGEIEPFQNPQFKIARPPSSFRSIIPEWLDSVVLRSIAIDPDDRYLTYSEMHFGIDYPEKVKPFIKAGAPLLERNPVLVYKVGFILSLLINLLLFFLLISGK